MKNNYWKFSPQKKNPHAPNMSQFPFLGSKAEGEIPMSVPAVAPCMLTLCSAPLRSPRMSRAGPCSAPAATLPQE